MNKEIWKQISEYKDYAVSNFGYVVSFKYGKTRILKPQISKVGHYQYVTLCKNGFSQKIKVSILVLVTFIGPCPKGMEVSHLNGDSLNDQLDNLVWEYHYKNMDRIEWNQVKWNRKGEENGNAQLTKSDIIQIKELLKQSYTQGYIAGLFNVHQVTISRIKSGQGWSHI